MHRVRANNSNMVVTNKTPRRRSKQSNTTEDEDVGANLVTPHYDEISKRLKTRIEVEKRVALRSVNYCTELLLDDCF